MKAFLTCIAVIMAAVAVLTAFRPAPSTPASMALKIDRILDSEKPLLITEYDLVNKWPKEIAPYFEYEMLTNGEAKVPTVKFFESTEAHRCFHILGYTYTFDQSGDVFLNDRFKNATSPAYQSISALTTLIHETAHIQGGDFSGMDSSVSEKNAQLATLEVLAGMANSGNKYARQALLDELRDVFMGVACSNAIKHGSLERFYKLGERIYGEAKNKRMRHWQNAGLDKYDEVLSKYCVSVYNDFQDFQFVCKAEGDKSPRVFIMDDLRAFLENLNIRME